MDSPGPDGGRSLRQWRRRHYRLRPATARRYRVRGIAGCGHEWHRHDNRLDFLAAHVELPVLAQDDGIIPLKRDHVVLGRRPRHAVRLESGAADEVQPRPAGIGMKTAVLQTVLVVRHQHEELTVIQGDEPHAVAGGCWKKGLIPELDMETPLTPGATVRGIPQVDLAAAAEKP